MRFIKEISIAVFGPLLGCAGVPNAIYAASSITESAIVEGVIGVSPILTNSCLSIWIPLPENLALRGIRWYNNDGTLAFPRVCVQSGVAESPASLKDASLVASEVLGGSNCWSEIVFSEPIAASGEGLYVLFVVPEGSAAEALGPGGGPAIGYTEASSGFPGWISSDGKDWIKVHPDFGFAVEPMLVDRDAGMLTKSGIAESEAAFDEMPPEREVVTWLYPAAPNPFNPRTTLNFTLKNDCFVDLAVFNVRGELVKTLVQGGLAAGQHTVAWEGNRSGGAKVASGVYFARLLAGNITMTQRLVLVQ